MNSGLSKRCLGQLSFVIGVAKSLSLVVETSCLHLHTDDQVYCVQLVEQTLFGAALLRDWRREVAVSLGGNVGLDPRGDAGLTG